MSVLSVFPVYWMFITSLKPASQIFDTALVPGNPSLENYAYVLKQIPIGQMLTNTFLMALFQTICEVLLGLLAAYAFACWSFRGSRALRAHCRNVAHTAAGHHDS